MAIRRPGRPRNPAVGVRTAPDGRIPAPAEIILPSEEDSDVVSLTNSILIGLLATATAPGADTKPPDVEVVAIPGGGVQPQAIVDGSGVIHLVFLRGEAGASDVYYASRKPGEPAFGTPIRVNSEPGSAIAIGSVRGARLAIGRSGRVHVAWNGTEKAKPANPIKGSPLLYSRSDESRAHFEPQRNLMTRTQGLDGGGSIAADGSGNVYVAWHGQGRNSTGEANRRMWVARSSDEGATFSIEEAISSRPTGACACCGTAALADSRGSVYLLFRAATDGVERDMILLTSRDRGRRFDEAGLDPWRLTACPMSTATLVEGDASVLAAWETKGEVYFARIDRETGRWSASTSPSGGTGTRKHPALATNRRGETLLAWTEGTGWQKGGALAWQVFDRSGRPIGPAGNLAGGIPVWGFSAVIARPDDGFTIIR
jgi:hypothetical protein